MARSLPFRFELHPSGDKAEALLGWASVTLYLNDEPFWFFGSKDAPQPVTWTWAEFLLHIATSWTALNVEESYPFDWLNRLTNPGKIWDLAETRWAAKSASTAEAEESKLLAFDCRHNLAAGFGGLNVPALTLLRSGYDVWVCGEDDMPIRASFKACIDHLEKFCENLAKAFEDSTDGMVCNAVTLWSARTKSPRQEILELATGISHRDLRLIFGSSSVDIDASSTLDLDSPVFADALLVAARMTRARLSASEIESVITKISAVAQTKSLGLDDASRAASMHVAKVAVEFPFETGYRLAEWARNFFGLELNQRAEVEELLAKWNISVLSRDLKSPEIDALAFWGGHGPCIFLNSSRAFIHRGRTRMTLAHELCHLLIDRNGALPAAEVLGGAVDSFVEQRANAFGAEFLLPRASVASAFDKIRPTNLSDLLNHLTYQFAVSKQLARWQIFNSDAFQMLSIFDRRMLEDSVHSEMEQKGLERIRVSM